ncbi:MAG: HNH endonuclease [Firmicutes bacterium]|nr:HNH endonuclease [Bacillota bacterium]
MPRLRSCKYCGRVHSSDYRCAAAPKREKEPTEITRLRTCRRWDQTRQAAYARDHFLCRVCFAQGILQSEGLEAHHITPLREDAELAYDLDNIITLCTAHHKAADAGSIRADALRALIQCDK